MSFRRIGAVAAAGALFIGLAGCGDDGDDNDDASSEQSDDNTDTDTDDTSVDVDDLNLDNEDCAEIAGAVSGFADLFSGQEGEPIDFAELADVIDDIDIDEVNDALGVLADSYRSFDEALGGPVDFSDPALLGSAEFAEASEVFDDPEVQAAEQELTAFTDENCAND